MIGGFGALIGVISLFAASIYLVGFAVVFIAFSIWMMVDANRERPDENGIHQIGSLLVLGACACVVFGGLVVFLAHWVPYAVVGWLTTGLYVSGFLAMFAALSGLLRLLGLLMAAAMIAGMILLPAPSEGATEDEENKWKVELTVVDADDNPIAGAITNCASVMVWAQQSAAILESGTGHYTDDEGKTEFEFTDDTRMKAAVCMAFVPSSRDEPGYAVRTGAVAAPVRGVTYPVQIRLTERTPPGSDCPVGSFSDEGMSCERRYENGYYNFKPGY